MYLARGPWDQREIESRGDVLLFTSDVLVRPTEVTGRLLASLHVSSDCPDTDFTVKLTDVHPDGRSVLIADGIQRARFRESFAREEFMQPGEVYELTVDLWSTSYIFNAGHRIRIAVSSSNRRDLSRTPTRARRICRQARRRWPPTRCICRPATRRTSCCRCTRTTHEPLRARCGWLPGPARVAGGTTPQKMHDRARGGCRAGVDACPPFRTPLFRSLTCQTVFACFRS